MSTPLWMTPDAPRWIDACRQSLCANYEPDYRSVGEARQLIHGDTFVRGVPPMKLCDHEWCLGILDVLTRVMKERS